MSRSGYSDDCDGWELIRWRGAVASAIKGKRGQGFLREMLAALDALPEKKLIAGDLEREGQVCAMGAVGRQRGIDMSKIDPEAREWVGRTFGIAPALVAEISFENDADDWDRNETDEHRFARVRAWIASKIK